MTRDELELYVMGEYDGDAGALEAGLDGAARAVLADEARFEMLLHAAADEAVFCPGCGDLVRDSRCDACGAAIAPGGYTVERVLVQNAHGRMYVAHDADGKQVALKELAFVQSPSLDMVAAFEREAKFLRALEHPAIPRFVASFEEGSGVHTRYYLAQELVTGEPLDAKLDNHFFTEAELVEIARQVLGVLVYLQSLSPMVIHRDIKPANLIRRADGTIAVVDFGAAHVQGATAGSTTIGTFGYMPIEQLAGVVDATTDPYALGASLLHLATRQEPWRILQTRNLEAINVSKKLRSFFTKLVAPEPRDRYRDASAALTGLDAPVAVEHVHRGWWRPFAMAAAVLVAVAGGFGAHALMTKHEPEKIVTVPPGVEIATLRIEMPGGGSAELFVDGKPVSTVSNGDEVPLSAGMRRVELRGARGECSELVMLSIDKPSMVICNLPDDRGAALPAGRMVDLSFKGAPLDEVLRILGKSCGVNVLVPDYIDAKIDINLKQAPCDQAFEVLLEAHGLAYDYRADANLARVATRKDLDAERVEDRVRRGIADDVLPIGPPVDLDFKDAPIHDLLKMFADRAKVNIVIDEGIMAKVTIVGHDMPWVPTLQSILRAHGLWYRYRPNGKIVRVAPRKDLDAER